MNIQPGQRITSFYEYGIIRLYECPDNDRQMFVNVVGVLEPHEQGLIVAVMPGRLQWGSEKQWCCVLSRFSLGWINIPCDLSGISIDISW